MSEMSDWDDTDLDQPQAPKALRDAYERQKRENAELAKQLNELSSEVRMSKLEKQMTRKGLPEKAVGLFPKDVDPTDEAVSKWVEEYGALFGTPASSTPVVPETAKTEEKPNSPEIIMADQFERMNQVSQSAPSSGPKSDLATMLQNPNLLDEVPYEDFLAAMRANGAKV